MTKHRGVTITEEWGLSKGSVSLASGEVSRASSNGIKNNRINIYGGNYFSTRNPDPSQDAAVTFMTSHHRHLLQMSFVPVPRDVCGVIMRYIRK